MIEDSGFPQVFGRYLLLRRLSRGGMGEVYLAKSGQISGFEKVVVIKRILPHLSRDKNFSRKFIQEANIAIKLSHVNIVPVLEVGKVAGEFFLALEFVEGRDLRSIQSACYKQGEKLPDYLALLIVRDLLTGLSYAHRRIDEMDRKLKIVHCDISPPNVLVSYNGEVKIIDFGIAKSIQEADDREETQMGFGKFGYMAPEQVLKGQEVDARTDLYSAGVVLWELLTGEKMIVFNETTPYKDIARKVVIEVPKKPSEFNPNISEELDTLVMKAIAKQPDDRFQSASEFRDAIQLALVHMAPTVTNDTLGEHITKIFSIEMQEQRDMLRDAKMVDMNLYQMELTTAMEATVSFAIGDEWTDMTGPISPGLPSPTRDSAPPPPLQSTSGTLSPGVSSSAMDYPLQPTPSFSGNITSSRSKTTPILVAAAVVSILLMGGIWFFMRGGAKDGAPATNNVNTAHTTSTLAPVMDADIIIEPTMDATAVPTPMVPTMTEMTMKPMPAVMRIARPMTTMKHVRTMANRVMKITPMVKKPDMAPDADAQFKKNVMARYRYISSKYSRFKASNGGVLEGQWGALRKFVIFKRGVPDFHKILNTKLSHFNSLMVKHKK